MFPPSMKLWPFSSLTCILVATTLLPAAEQDQSSTPPKIRPLRSRKLAVLSEDRYSHRDEQPECAFSPDGKWLITGSYQLMLWDLTTGKQLDGFGRVGSVKSAFSPDSKTIITVGGERYREMSAVDLWDVAYRKRIRSLDEGVNFTHFSSVAFSPDGKTIALTSGAGRRTPEHPTIYFWDVTTGFETRKVQCPSPGKAARGRESEMPTIECIEYSPDGRSLAMVSDDKLLLLEVATAKQRCQIGTLPTARRDNEQGLPTTSRDVAFSPDGRVVAVACTDGIIRLWDVLTKTELTPLAGHRGEVLAVVFTPDGKALKSFGHDNRVLTWSTKNLRQVWHPRKQVLSSDDLSRLWNDLRGEDPLAFHWAIRILAANPEQGLKLMQQHLKPVPPVDSQRINQLVADLSNEEFNRRKRAVLELRKLGELALPALHKASENNYSEILRSVYFTTRSKYPTEEQHHAQNALLVLARMGTDDARKTLQGLAKGAPEAGLTRQAELLIGQMTTPGETEKAVSMEEHWERLAKQDSSEAFESIQALIGNPKDSVPMLRDRLKAWALRVDDSPTRVAQLIKDLDHRRFEVREQAYKSLEELGSAPKKLLEDALKNSPSLEASSRIEKLLKQLKAESILPHQLQLDRALEALELIGSDEVRHVLKELIKQSRSGRLKAAFQTSLGRLDQGSAKR